ncbi:MAG: ATP-dependent sacrificial sulfur transferase LarE [Deltaproteobacteria bacterium]|jgi:uncharacterized protein|nr:ATP-dependent sacrificial sulfur transferase LarE [Deltaproteobacteria bacterium]
MLPSDIASKVTKLEDILKNLKSVAIAFSGGVDSSLLAKVSHMVLGDMAVAVTGRSHSFPLRELEAARKFTAHLGLKHIEIDSEELALPGFSNNPPNRCYLCKHELFSKITSVAKDLNLNAVIEASNIDDEGDYRPGLKALKELGVVSPLRLASLSKAEIRLVSKELGLNTWDKPSFACLASRFPYGEIITTDRLDKIDMAETFLLDLGLKQVRVRFHDHGDLARIETDDEGLSILMTASARLLVAERFQKLGFLYTSVDLSGYRSGSMNLSLSNDVKDAAMDTIGQ